MHMRTVPYYTTTQDYLQSGKFRVGVYVTCFVEGI